MFRSLAAIFITCLFVTAGVSRAEEGAKIAVRTLNLGEGDLEGVYLKRGDSFVSLHFSKRQISKKYQATFKSHLPVFRSAPASGEGDEFVPLGTAKIPANSKGILLLAWKEGDAIEFNAIRDDFGNAGPGDWLLVNATEKQIGFQVGKGSKPMGLKPGQSGTYRVRIGKDQGAAVTGVFAVDGKMKTFYSTYWPVRRDKRNLVLFLPKGDKIKVKKIVDQGLAEDQAKKES